MARNEERRVKVFCVTCSFAPDDLFFPVGVAAAIKGTWFFFSFAVCIAIFARRDCDDDVPTMLAVSVAGFTFLQLLAFSHKLILFVASARGTIREPKHKFVRELLLIGAGIYVFEIIWAVYNMVAVLHRNTTSKVSCNEFQRPFTTYVVLVWLNWLELALVALVYFSCLDRCRFFCCRAVCVCQCCADTGAAQHLVPSDGDHHLNVETAIKVIPTSHSLSASYLCSIFRDKCCTCRRDGLNNSKNIALRDVSDALEVLYRDIEIHYTALDRLSGWVLVQKYHGQLLTQGKKSLVNQELLQATLRFLKKKGVIQKNHVVREPRPLEAGSRLPETLLYYYWFAMASYGWTVKVFLEPVSGLYTICRDARVCGREEQEEGVEKDRSVVFLKSAEVASIAGIDVNDIFLGKTASDIHCPPFYVCRTVRKDPVTGHEKKEIVITIRGTLSVKDVMTSFTASMRDATKCQESLVEKWFLLLVKTKLTFLGVEDAYFHTGFYKSAKVMLNILRKSNQFRKLVEEQHYCVVVTGHSLGAGVGAILTLLIKHKHPHWAEGLHAYLYAVPGAVCSYELAERAEELDIITSVVGAHDIVSRVSWRALTYLKLLVRKALEETSLKKHEVLCCGNLPTWNPSIFGGSIYPVGLIDEQSGAATPDFFELQESLPIIRASTWDQEAIKKKKKQEKEKRAKEEEVVQDEFVEYQERRKTSTDDELNEVTKRLQQSKQVKIGPVVLAPLEECSEEKRGRKVVDAERAERVATSFLQEKSRLGPLMFLPGRVLHIEEEEKDDEGTPVRWCGVGVFGLRCCGIRCTRNKKIRANWKAREDLTGIILHRDCLVDHSPRRSFAMLRRLAYQASIQAGPEAPSSLTDARLSQQNTETKCSESSALSDPPALPAVNDEPSAVVVVTDNPDGNAECSHNTTTQGVCDSSADNTGGSHTLSAEVHEQSEL